jgi:hypothetical protein
MTGEGLRWEGSALAAHSRLERVTGIEPALSAWESVQSGLHRARTWVHPFQATRRVRLSRFTLPRRLAKSSRDASAYDRI